MGSAVGCSVGATVGATVGTGGTTGALLVAEALGLALAEEEADADALGLTLCEELAEAEALAEALGLALFEEEADADALGLAVAEELALADAEAEALGLAVAEEDAEELALAEAVLLALVVELGKGATEVVEILGLALALALAEVSAVGCVAFVWAVFATEAATGMAATVSAAAAARAVFILSCRFPKLFLLYRESVHGLSVHPWAHIAIFYHSESTAPYIPLHRGALAQGALFIFIP